MLFAGLPSGWVAYPCHYLKQGPRQSGITTAEACVHACKNAPAGICDSATFDADEPACYFHNTYYNCADILLTTTTPQKFHFKKNVCRKYYYSSTKHY